MKFLVHVKKKTIKKNTRKSEKNIQPTGHRSQVRDTRLNGSGSGSGSDVVSLTQRNQLFSNATFLVQLSLFDFWCWCFWLEFLVGVFGCVFGCVRSFFLCDCFVAVSSVVVGCGLDIFFTFFFIFFYCCGEKLLCLIVEAKNLR